MPSKKFNNLVAPLNGFFHIVAIHNDQGWLRSKKYERRSEMRQFLTFIENVYIQRIACSIENVRQEKKSFEIR